jgi:general secretion pathway protein K
MRQAQRDKSRGAVLVIVLWVLGLLSALSLSLSYRAGLEAKRVGAINGKVQSLALCQAALQRMVYVLEEDSDAYDTLSDAWGNDPDLFAGYQLESGTYSIAHTLEGEPSITLYGADDEESRINVNTATKPVWERLLTNAGVSPNIHEAILDWIDADSNLRYYGAEAYDYGLLPDPYTPRNAKIPRLVELLLIKDFTQELLEKISPLLTVHGDGKVNINTASGPVLEAVGFTEEIVEKILHYRKGPDGKPATEDDGIFRDVKFIAETLSTTEYLSTTERAAINNLAPLLTVRSRFFRMSIEGQSTGGKKTRLETVVERAPQGPASPVRILSWRED